MQALHKRMEPLLLFFVDAATAIDADDHGWHLFTIVEEAPKVPGAPGPAVVGFATTYRRVDPSCHCAPERSGSLCQAGLSCQSGKDFCCAARLYTRLHGALPAPSIQRFESTCWHPAQATTLPRTPSSRPTCRKVPPRRRRFWHYPEGSRLRLAQILVLPPHQGRGAGALALQAAQALADELDACDLAVRLDPASPRRSLTLDSSAQDVV